MTALAASTTAASTILASWWICSRVAARRNLELGDFPPVLLAAPTVVVALAAAGGTVSTPAAIAVGGTSVAALVDARTGLVFDALSLPLLAAALLAAAVGGEVVSAVIGAIAAASFLGLLYGITGGRGLGFGDVKLGALVGSALAWPVGPIALGYAFVLGATWGLALLLSRRASRSSAIRFGPFVAAGTLLAVLFPRWSP